ATRASLWRKVLWFFVPTAIGVLLFLVPLCCILWPAARAALVTPVSPALVGLGLLLVIAGRVTTFVATLQLRAQQRTGGGLPQGLFRWARHPGVCGLDRESGV